MQIDSNGDVQGNFSLLARLRVPPQPPSLNGSMTYNLSYAMQPVGTFELRPLVLSGTPAARASRESAEAASKRRRDAAASGEKSSTEKIDRLSLPVAPVMNDCAAGTTF